MLTMIGGNVYQSEPRVLYVITILGLQSISRDAANNREVQIWLPIPLPLPQSTFQSIRCAGPTQLTNQIV